MSQDSNLLQTIERACDGLLFPSETDAPLQVLLALSSGDGSAEIADAQPTGETLQEFFAASTSEEDWMNAEEKATAQRFGALVELLQSQLSEIRVLRTTGTPSDVYIVGHHDGQTITVKTQVVET